MCVNTWFDSNGTRLDGKAATSARAEAAAVTGEVNRTHPHRSIAQMWEEHRKATWGTKQTRSDFQGIAFALADGSCIPVWA